MHFIGLIHKKLFIRMKYTNREKEPVALFSFSKKLATKKSSGLNVVKSSNAWFFSLFNVTWLKVA